MLCLDGTLKLYSVSEDRQLHSCSPSSMVGLCNVICFDFCISVCSQLLSLQLWHSYIVTVLYVFAFQPMSSIFVMPETKSVIAGSWDNNMYVSVHCVKLFHSLIWSHRNYELNYYLQFSSELQD